MFNDKFLLNNMNTEIGLPSSFHRFANFLLRPHLRYMAWYPDEKMREQIEASFFDFSADFDAN